MVRNPVDEPRYNAKSVLAYVKAHTITDYTSLGRQRIFINKYPIEEVHRLRIKSWRGQQVVGLAKLDEFLVRYGLSISDYEEWCTEHNLPVAA